MTIPLCLLYLVFFLSYECIALYANIWLSDMADDGDMIGNYTQAYYYQIELKTLNASIANSPQTTQPASQANMTILQTKQIAALNNAGSIRRFYLWWYLGFGCFQAFFVLVFSLLYAYMVASASRYIHKSMIGT